MNQQNQNSYLNLYPMQQPVNQQQMPQQMYAPTTGSYAPQGQNMQSFNISRYQQSSLFSDRFLKGLLIGAAAAYILTNESVQRTAIKGAVKAWSLMQGGVEEIKERFHDAEAELRAESGE